MTAMRQLVGEVLRARRIAQGLTLRDVSAKARVSLGYISEVERGQKEPSSELLAALAGALDVPLSKVLLDVSALLAHRGGHRPGQHLVHRPRRRRLGCLIRACGTASSGSGWTQLGTGYAASGPTAGHARSAAAPRRGARREVPRSARGTQLDAGAR